MATKASDIQVLEGIEGIRAKPGMYGCPDKSSAGIFFITREVVDNALDEALAGRNNLIEITVNTKTNTISVRDGGGGIPVDIHEKTKQSILTTVFTKLHAGGKLNAASTAYKASRGTHGVGVTVTNALSQSFTVTTVRKTGAYKQTFARGVATSKVTKVTSPLKKGTLIEFVPDTQIFGKSKIDVSFLKEWLEDTAYLHGGLKLVLNIDGKSTTYLKKGIEELVAREIGEEEALTPIYSINNEAYQLALCWAPTGSGFAKTFVNGLHTKDGGTHEKALGIAVNKSLTKYALKKHTESLKHAMNGATFVLNVFVSNPDFKGQSKDALITPVTLDGLEAELDNLFAKNKSAIRSVLDYAHHLKSIEEAYKQGRKAIASINSRSSKNFGSFGKHKRCLTTNPEERVLTIIEGDSAAGTADKARDKQYQEILSLKGKPPNPIQKRDKIFTNSEYLGILQAIGFSDKEDWWTKTRRVGKVVLLADPDPDGAHITNILIGFFQVVCPEFIENGRLFVVDAPLYMANVRDKKVFGPTLEDVKAKAGSKAIVTRIKGWGEIDADVLETIAFSPTSVYTKVTAEKNATKAFNELLDKDSSVRKLLVGV